MPWPLTLLGGVGAGKTCAALALCDHVPGSHYTTLKEVCDDAISAGKGNLSWRNDAGTPVSITPAMYWRRLMTYPLLVVDEMGLRDRVSDFVYETLFAVLEARAGTPAVFISNLTADGVRQVFDDRVLSRLAAGTIINMAGQDLRIQGRGR